MQRRPLTLVAGPVVAAAMLVACGSEGVTTETVTTETETTETETTEDVATATTTAATTVDADQRFPDVIAATAVPDGDGTWRFDVTVSSPYDTPVRYADAWRIVGDDGEVYGVRELTHDHQAEQPFTRSLSGVPIPEGVTAVTIEGRDRRFGWGGGTVEVALADG